MPFAKWLQNMEQTPRRLIILSNLKYDFRTKKLSKETIKRFLLDIGKKWATCPWYSRPEKMIIEVSKSNDKLYLCKGNGAPKHFDSCSRVIDATSLWMNNIRPSVGGLDTCDEVPDGDINILERNGLYNVIYGNMANSRGFAWITPTEEINELRKKCSNDYLPGAVRDKLGLRHFNEDEKLVEVVYPSNFLNNNQIKPPTFIEGSRG